MLQPHLFPHLAYVKANEIREKEYWPSISRHGFLPIVSFYQHGEVLQQEERLLYINVLVSNIHMLIHVIKKLKHVNEYKASMSLVNVSFSDCIIILHIHVWTDTVVVAVRQSRVFKFAFCICNLFSSLHCRINWFIMSSVDALKSMVLLQIHFLNNMNIKSQIHRRIPGHVKEMSQPGGSGDKGGKGAVLTQSRGRRGHATV